jgi:hypothetical protein
MANLYTVMMKMYTDLQWLPVYQYRQVKGHLYTTDKMTKIILFTFQCLHLAVGGLDNIFF